MQHIEGQRARTVKRIFYGIMFFGLISSALYGIATGGENAWGVLINDGRDTFMDFYNPINHAAKADPYTDVDKVNPALAYVLFFLLSLFIPQATSTDAPDIQRSQNGQAVFIICAVFVMIFLGMLLYRLIQGRRREKITMLALLLLSAPFIFAYERGNIILVALVFSTLFLMLKDAPDRLHRELALLCLAISANLKIYPAVLGLLLLKEKRYQEAAKCALYGAILFVAPFLLMGGLDKIPMLLGNLMAGSANTVSLENGFGYKVNISNLVSILAGLFGVFGKSVIQAGHYIAYGLLALSLVVAFFLKSKWKTIALLSLLMAGVPGFSFAYCLVFMAVPCILFLNGQEGYRKMDYVYAVLFAALFGLFVYGEYDCFLDLGGKLIVNVCTFVESCALFLMLILINGEGILEIARGCSKRKMAGAERGAESLRQEECPEPEGRMVCPRNVGGDFFARVAQIARNIGLERCFYGIMLTAIGLLLARSLTAAVSPLCNILSTDEGSRHMGFYQLIYEAGYLRPYQMGGTYPAAVYLAFGLLKTIVPFPFVHAGGALLRSNQTAIMLWYVFFLLSSLLLILLLHRVKQGNSLGRWMFTGCVLLSAPFLYLYDRGDITLVPLILILLFFWMKDHQTAWIRECGLICLALSCGLGVMHFLFGLYFAAKKDYRRLKRWLLYAVIVFFVPFFIFGGLEGIGSWYLNIKAADSASRAAGFGYKVSISNTVSMLFALADQLSPQMGTFGNFLGLAALGLGVVAVFGLKEDWKRVALITAAMVLVPQESPVSALVLMVPSLVLFFNAREKGAYQWLYLFCYCGLFVPVLAGAYPWFAKLPGILAVRLGTVAESISLVLMLVFLIVEGMKGLTTIQRSEEGTNV